MRMIEFGWDEHKNRIIIEKHGVSFDEASTVFYDDYAILFDDPDHSDEEDRFLILGITRRENLCIVSHCYRGEDGIIRIISARKATKQETKTYNFFSEGVSK
ncbi:MAG: BrnT family toxin [Oscillospiraceae bacterium]|nr:BrnT family toxin [Oscillospiraceae bacterium]